MRYTPLTQNDPVDIAREIYRVIRCRGQSRSRDRHYRRKIHHIVVFDEPVCIYRDSRSDVDGARLPPTHEVARGAAYLPGRGLTTVRCVVEGESEYADWEYDPNGDEALPNLVDYLAAIREDDHPHENWRLDYPRTRVLLSLQDAIDCAVPGKEGDALLLAWRRAQHRIRAIRANND